MVFVDDILMYIWHLSEHNAYLYKVLSIIIEHHLYINRNKCFFGQPRLEYLSHWIFGDRVATDVKKVKTIQN